MRGGGRGGRGAPSDPLVRLEREPLRAWYLLHGEEGFLIERALAVLRRRLLPPGRPGTWRTLWGGRDGAQLAAALEDLASPPLFGGPQVLVVRHADALGEEEQARVLEAMPAIGAGGALALVARTADQRRRLFATCGRAGAAFAFPGLADAGAAQAWVARLGREAGHDVAPAAAAELVERAGVDLGVLAGEVEKLGLHVGPGARIDAADVRAVVAGVRAHRVWELTDRLSARDAGGAARLLRELLDEGEPPVRLVAFLAANLRRCLHAAEMAAQGLAADEIARRLRVAPWLVGKLVGRRGVADLERGLMVLARLDLALKSSRATEALFEAALLELVGAAPA